MLFGGRIGSSCWSGRFYVCFCSYYNSGSLPSPIPLLSWCLVKFSQVKVFSGAPETLANHSLPTGPISPRVFYSGCLNCIHRPCNRGVAVFSHVRPYNFPCFQVGYIPLGFNLKYIFFCKRRKMLHKPDDFVGSLHIEFSPSSLRPRGLGPFHCIWHMTVVFRRLPFSVHIVGIWLNLRGAGT